MTYDVSVAGTEKLGTVAGTGSLAWAGSLTSSFAQRRIYLMESPWSWVSIAIMGVVHGEPGRESAWHGRSSVSDMYYTISLDLYWNM